MPSLSGRTHLTSQPADNAPMPTQEAISTTLQLLNQYNPCRVMPPLSHDQYAAEAFSFAALHEQGRLSLASATLVLRFWYPHINHTKTPGLDELLGDITAHLQ